MEMSREEIIRKYKEAKYKKGYIQILAELNGVDKSVIRKILIDAGITLPGNPNFGKGEKKKMVIPEEIKKQLELDLKDIDVQIAELTKRSNVIWHFLKENTDGEKTKGE